MRTSVTFVATLLASAMAATPVLAQDSASGSPEEPVAGDAIAESGVNEGSQIVVTALKGAQNLQDTPAAISVVSGEELVDRNVTDVRALGTLVPSMKTNVEGTATQIFARGVGKQYDTGAIPDPVGMVIDGLSIPQHSTGFALFDVNSVQVLPGPQGTLYGSSAIGGVVNVTTNRPEANMEGSASLTVGNYGIIRGTAAQNFALSESLYVRAAFAGNYNDGYNSNDTFDENMTAVRLSALFEPTGDLSFFVTGTYAWTDYHQSPTIPFPLLTDDPYEIPPFDPDTAIFYPPNGGPTDARVKMDYVSITGEIVKEFGDVTATYTGGYLKKNTPGGRGNEADLNRFSVAGFRQILSNDNELFNNELRLSADTSRISWIAGLYQMRSQTDEFFVFGPNLSGFDISTIMESYAAYGQATFSVSDTTRLTGGLRASSDTVRVGDGAQVFFPTGNFPNFDRGIIPFSYSENWERLNWKVGLEQEFSADTLFYANVQSGFNPGTYDGNPPNPQLPVQAQSMIGYTAGLKNRFFDILTLNVEGYLYNYRDQIIAVPNLVNGSNILANAQRSRIYGIQIDSSLNLATNTNLRASLGYLHARFTEFAYTSGGIDFDYAGNTTPYSPEFTANLGATQVFELGNFGSIEARADTYLTSSYWFTFSNAPANFKQRGYSKTDLSLTYRTPDERFQVGIWVKNLENEAVAASSGVAPGRAYPGVVYLEPPRTYGLRLSAEW
jgi:iron complex outermembrane recepter protein